MPTQVRLVISGLSRPNLVCRTNLTTRSWPGWVFKYYFRFTRHNV